jgi:hypothetical protein
VEYALGFNSDYFRYARTLVRAPEERAKPNNERLREYSESKLPSVTQNLLSTAPVYPEFERVKFALGLTKLREVLGTDDALVEHVLGRESPHAVADRLVAATKLGDPTVRKALWDGGAEALARSDDPFIALARSVDPAARSIRKQYENEVESVVRKNSELIAAARFEKYGTTEYPDATFTQRFSFGEVKGWEAKGKWVDPCADIAGAFARATGSEPFALPQSWLDSKERLDPKQCFNFVTSNDVIGGNSGSPVINRKAEVVGLVFDGNIESLGGDYWFDERANRAIAVHSGAIIQALTKVYKADRLVREIEAARRNH